MAESKIKKFQVESGNPVDELVTTPQPIPDDTVAVSSGVVVLADGVTVQLFEAASSSSFGPVTSPDVIRWDLLSVDLTQDPPVLSITGGTPNTLPIDWFDGIPPVPLGYLPVAAIQITEQSPASVVISSDDIIDTRGFFTRVRQDVSTVSYTPTTSSDWSSVPTTSQDALDQLASRLNSGGAGRTIDATTSAAGSSKVAARDDHVHDHGDLTGVVTLHHDSIQVEFIPTDSDEYPELTDAGAPWETYNDRVQGLGDYLGHRINRHEILRTWFPDWTVDSDTKDLQGIILLDGSTLAAADYAGTPGFSGGDDPTATAISGFAYLYVASNDYLTVKKDGQAPSLMDGAWCHPTVVNGIVFHFIGSIPIESGPAFKACTKLSGKVEYLEVEDVGDATTISNSLPTGTIFTRSTTKPGAWGSSTDISGGGSWWGPPGSSGPCLHYDIGGDNGSASYYTSLDNAVAGIKRCAGTGGTNYANITFWHQPTLRDSNGTFWLYRTAAGTSSGVFGQCGYIDIGG